MFTIQIILEVIEDLCLYKEKTVVEETYPADVPNHVEDLLQLEDDLHHVVDDPLHVIEEINLSGLDVVLALVSE